MLSSSASMAAIAAASFAPTTEPCAARSRSSVAIPSRRRWNSRRSSSVVPAGGASGVTARARAVSPLAESARKSIRPLSATAR